MPEALYHVGSVQYGDTFAIVGGQKVTLGYSDAVYLYNTATEEFDLLDERLSEPKGYVTTIIVNKEIFPEC